MRDSIDRLREEKESMEASLVAIRLLANTERNDDLLRSEVLRIANGALRDTESRVEAILRHHTAVMDGQPKQRRGWLSILFGK